MNSCAALRVLEYCRAECVRESAVSSKFAQRHSFSVYAGLLVHQIVTKLDTYIAIIYNGR